MADKSHIQWTDATWNPVTGCTKVTDGCDNCYAETLDKRFHEQWYGEPFVPWDDAKQRAAERSPIQLHPDRLDQPLRWKRPRRIFVNSMSDLFHPDVPFEFIAQVFGVMAKSYWHTFQVLTKRPAIAARFLTQYAAGGRHIWKAAQAFEWPQSRYREINAGAGDSSWPIRNVWIGVSVTGGKETATYLDQLARYPSAVRFVSYEPALQGFDFRPWLGHGDCICEDDSRYHDMGCPQLEWAEVIDWLIVGGESGAKARPFNVAWAEACIEQCRAAGVPVFVKQLGSEPRIDVKDCHLWETPIRDPKGGDWDEWPEALRVREFPEVSHG